jgi:hypothetical protein
MMDRNYFKIGDKVKMKTGEILTIKSLEYLEFTCEEKAGYIPKSDIKKIQR